MRLLVSLLLRCLPVLWGQLTSSGAWEDLQSGVRHPLVSPLSNGADFVRTGLRRGLGRPLGSV